MENIKKGLIPFIIGFFVCFLIFTVVGCSDLSSQPTYTKDEIEWATSDALPEALVDMEEFQKFFIQFQRMTNLLVRA